MCSQVPHKICENVAIRALNPYLCEKNFTPQIPLALLALILPTKYGNTIRLPDGPCIFFFIILRFYILRYHFVSRMYNKHGITISILNH